ncbi:MAG: hypothetical protein LCH81_02045 [Bacteroidetes bacterium]|nr:hypothetical protein [Bacteroidota bacterium]
MPALTFCKARTGVNVARAGVWSGWPRVMEVVVWTLVRRDSAIYGAIKTIKTLFERHKWRYPDGLKSIPPPP